jgi:hypothetical protein
MVSGSPARSGSEGGEPGCSTVAGCREWYWQQRGPLPGRDGRVTPGASSSALAGTAPSSGPGGVPEGPSAAIPRRGEPTPVGPTAVTSPVDATAHGVTTSPSIDSEAVRLAQLAFAGFSQAMQQFPALQGLVPPTQASFTQVLQQAEVGGAPPGGPAAGPASPGLAPPPVSVPTDGPQLATPAAQCGGSDPVQTVQARAHRRGPQRACAASPSHWSGTPQVTARIARAPRRAQGYCRSARRRRFASQLRCFRRWPIPQRMGSGSLVGSRRRGVSFRSHGRRHRFECFRTDSLQSRRLNAAGGRPSRRQAASSCGWQCRSTVCGNGRADSRWRLDCGSPSSGCGGHSPRSPVAGRGGRPLLIRAVGPPPSVSSRGLQVEYIGIAFGTAGGRRPACGDPPPDRAVVGAFRSPTGVSSECTTSIGDTIRFWSGEGVSKVVAPCSVRTCVLCRVLCASGRVSWVGLQDVSLAVQSCPRTYHSPPSANGCVSFAG